MKFRIKDNYGTVLGEAEVEWLPGAMSPELLASLPALFPRWQAFALPIEGHPLAPWWIEHDPL